MQPSIPFHLNINLSQSNAFSHVAMDAYSSQSVNIQEIFNAYQYRIYKLDFCFSNFHIFRFLRSGTREVDVNNFMSKHSSDYNALLCYDPLAQLAIDASSGMKSCQSQVNESLRKTYHYQQNVPQHYYLLDILVYKILLLVYKAINGFSPSYISNLLSFCSSSFSLRSCSNKVLQVLRSNLKSYGDPRFSIAGPKLWNSTPASLRNADSLNSFKNHLKTIYFT